MDDPRWEPGMPVLDRQAVPTGPTGSTAPPPPAASARPLDRIPETAPTPLQPYYINLSAIALVCGFVAITALETGSTLASPLVKLCILVGGPLLVVTTADAILRIWRSAWAWMPLNRGRGLFRLTWVAVASIGLAVAALAWLAALTA
jgi:hypothetical protein